MVHVSCYVTKIKAILENIFKNITLVTKKYKKIIKNHKKKQKKMPLLFVNKTRLLLLFVKSDGAFLFFLYFLTVVLHLKFKILYAHMKDGLTPLKKQKIK